jgi:hypothetical protein
MEGRQMLMVLLAQRTWRDRPHRSAARAAGHARRPQRVGRPDQHLFEKARFRIRRQGEVTYGNYDYWRFGGSVTGPISDTLAARLDGVWVKRDGFLHDVEQRSATSTIATAISCAASCCSSRPISVDPPDRDYTSRRSCCGATYVATKEDGRSLYPAPRTPTRTGDYALSASNNIVDVLRASASRSRRSESGL